MTAQDMIMASQLTRVRELQTQLQKAAAENSRLAAENAELNAHFDLAILAAEDLRNIPENGKLIIIDGWNMILGDTRHAPSISPWQSRNADELIAKAQRHLAERSNDFVWIVFDGPKERVRMVGGDEPENSRLRVSYTGGKGMHRADRFICDFLRMACFRGVTRRIQIETNDKDLKVSVAKFCP